MGYVDEVLEKVSKKNADQPEFLQAVNEVLDTKRFAFGCKHSRFTQLLWLFGGL